MRIKDIQVGKVSIPLKKPFKTALRVAYSAEDIIVKVIADTGETGYGGAPPTAVITGDTQGSVVAAIRDVIKPKLIGMDISAIEDIMKVLHSSIVHNSTARAAVDMAVYDLFGQFYGIPLFRLFGGARAAVTTDITISVNSPEEMVADSLQAVAEGYTELKMKVGTDSKLDVERVKAVRQAVGPNICIRLDANQGWRAKEAVTAIRRFEDLGMDIELVEQPVKAEDIEGLKFVTDNVDTLIMADEAVFSPRQAFQILSMRAADIINIKLTKAGGIYNALAICQMAETMGVECMMGCMLESKVGVTAAASLMAGKKNITRADLDAAVLLAQDPVVGGVSYDKNRLLLPEVPGLGITHVEGWQEII